MEYGCPVSCKYCMVTKINSRSSKWLQKHRWGINKTVLFLNRLPNDIPVKDMNIDTELFAGEYVGFQGITDAFWDIFIEDLKYMCSVANNSEMKKLVLATKEIITNKQWDILKNTDKRKLQLVVSITGLDDIELTKTKDRLKNIENALKYDINVLPIIHPYIYKVSDISFLKELHSLGIKEISYKGFRYNHKNMKSWSENLIPKNVLELYKKNEEKEILLGEDYLKEEINKYNLKVVNFRKNIHKDNGIKGIDFQRAKGIVDIIFDKCVVSSSDNNRAVYNEAISRRL